MQINNEIFVKHPYEYFYACFLFVFKMHEVTAGEKSRIELVKWYTEVYSLLTNYMYANDEENSWIMPLLDSFEEAINTSETPEEAGQRVYELYAALPFAKKKHGDKDYIDLVASKRRFGCFALSAREYYRSQGLVRLQFMTVREGLNHPHGSKWHVSDLSSIYLEKRRDEFVQMLQSIKQNPEVYGNPHSLISCTWLQNIPNYRNLFPTEGVEISPDLGSIPWSWKQFIKWDYSGSTARVDQFKQTLVKAQTKEQVENSIPFIPLKMIVPLEVMYQMYQHQLS